MRRRRFLGILGGAAAWPLSARAQQPERMRRVGVLASSGAEATDAQDRQAAFLEELQRLGWTDGRNVQIDTRWGVANLDDIRKFAAELVAAKPDVVLASGGVALERLLEASHTVPIVFTIVVDPVGSGFVDTLSQPGGNATGFMQFEYSLTAKWLELLKQIAPGLSRVAVLRDAATSAGIGQFAVIQSVAPSVGVEVSPINGRDAREIERAIASFARNSNGGLIVTSTAVAAVHRDLIIALAARYKLPAVYSNRVAVTGGGLASYGADFVDQFRRAAGYVDRILKGERPSEMPVQAPNKYVLVINLKTAKALGIEIPAAVLARADEVIE